MDEIEVLSSENVVVILSKNSCCICHSIKRLFYELGANPVVHELDELELSRRKEIEQALIKVVGCNPTVPAVFIAGKFVGTAEKVMTLHLNGSLKNMLS